MPSPKEARPMASKMYVSEFSELVNEFGSSSRRRRKGRKERRKSSCSRSNHDHRLM